MESKLTRLTHKIAIQLHLVAALPFAVFAPGGQSGNFWVHPRNGAELRLNFQKVKH